MTTQRAIDRWIEELAHEYADRDAGEARERALREARARAEAEAQVRALRASEARARQQQVAGFLRTLDARSALGRWFDDFARAYPSRSEAAEVYLQSLAEAERLR